jgi:type IV secretory pathway TraG/TraD family ATPase VirD4
MRERLRPLISLWLDLLVLRLMNEGISGRKTRFVLDELASLQRLPQLMTAVTENRKSNNPMVLGFQGKAQVEALYGHVSEPAHARALFPRVVRRARADGAGGGHAARA